MDPCGPGHSTWHEAEAQVMQAQVEGGATASAVTESSRAQEGSIRPCLHPPSILEPSPRASLLFLPGCIFWQIPVSRAQLLRAFFSLSAGQGEGSGSLL